MRIKQTAALLQLIPISICDGINEKGVVWEMNVVRFVLDNAVSAKESVALLEESNLCIPWDWSGMKS